MYSSLRILQRYGGTHLPMERVFIDLRYRLIANGTISSKTVATRDLFVSERIELDLREEPKTLMVIYMAETYFSDEWGESVSLKVNYATLTVGLYQVIVESSY
jgi:hypothetical protein